MRLFSLWILKYINISLGFLYILCIDLPSPYNPSDSRKENQILNAVGPSFACVAVPTQRRRRLLWYRDVVGGDPGEEPSWGSQDRRGEAGKEEV